MGVRFIAGIMAACAAVVCALAPAPASAQGREGVYTVAGVRVDAVADNASAARDQAFAAGHRQAFERLVRRITLPDQLQRLGMPTPDQSAVERMVSSFDVADERRSGTRYLGRLTLRFLPSAVQTYLSGAGFSIVDQRTAPILVVPLVTDVTPQALEAWRQAWEQGGYDSELAPLIPAPRELQGAPDWAAASRYAIAVGAGSALYLDLRIAGDQARATAIEVGGNGLRRDRGTAQVRIGADQVSGLQALADQVADRIQSDWKSRLTSAATQQERVSATVEYANLAEWLRIKGGLEAAAATMIRDIRIEAVARQGALVSFSYVGDRQALAEELRRHGVSMEDGATGPVLRARRR
ncbi:MAG: DUF2066 domain-containing protein [Alphaproteobacteria bacterium]|nr:DUF2066 domain-containing protein [Alphaproteobacteria bacterium]